MVSDIERNQQAAYAAAGTVCVGSQRSQYATLPTMGERSGTGATFGFDFQTVKYVSAISRRG